MFRLFYLLSATPLSLTVSPCHHCLTYDENLTLELRNLLCRFSSTTSQHINWGTNSIAFNRTHYPGKPVTALSKKDSDRGKHWIWIAVLQRNSVLRVFLEPEKKLTVWLVFHVERFKRKTDWIGRGFQEVFQPQVLSINAKNKHVTRVVHLKKNHFQHFILIQL